MQKKLADLRTNDPGPSGPKSRRFHLNGTYFKTKKKRQKTKKCLQTFEEMTLEPLTLEAAGDVT